MTIVADVLDRLLALHRLDEDIRVLAETLDRVPQAVAERLSVVQELERKIQLLEEKMLSARTQVRSRETEIRGFDAKLERLKQQSGAVRTNKEFMAFKSEIANLQVDSDRMQGEVLKMLDVLQQAEARVAELKQQRSAEQGRAAEAQAKATERMAAVGRERAGLESRRGAMLVDIPKEALDAYNRVRLARGGGLARMEGHYCGGCGALMTKNDIYAVQNRSRIVPCPSCNRLLYLG